MSDTEREWRESLRVGDEVAIQVELGRIEIAHVTHVTAKCVVVHCAWLPGIAYRFRIDDGIAMRAGKLFRPTLHQSTEFFREIQPIFKIAHRVRFAELSKLSTSQLRRIAAILDEPKEKNDEV